MQGYIHNDIKLDVQVCKVQKKTCALIEVVIWQCIINFCWGFLSHCTEYVSVNINLYILLICINCNL